MASQTVSNLTDILKEVWTQDRLERQFYDGTPWINDLKKTSEYTKLGKEAEVPLHTGLGGGDTILSSAGGTINAADPEVVNRATFGLAYDWRQISIEFGALNQASADQMASVAEAKSLEIESKVLACNMSMQRQFLGDGTAKIVKCGTTTTNNVVVLDATDGPNVIQRGFLRVGQQVDIGTAASEASLIDGESITAVDKSTPSITVTTSISTTSADFVSIKNARSGSTSNESMGLLGIAGTSGNSVGGLSTSDFAAWDPATVDSTSTVMTIDVPLDLQLAVQQETGELPTDVLTSFKQIRNLYGQLQTQQRFQGDLVRSGNYMALDWAGMKIRAYQPVLDRLFFMYSPKDLLICTGAYKGPIWASSIEGTNQGLRYATGATNFGDSLVYAAGLACRSRRTSAAATQLTA